MVRKLRLLREHRIGLSAGLNPSPPLSPGSRLLSASVAAAAAPPPPGPSGSRPRAEAEQPHAGQSRSSRSSSPGLPQRLTALWLRGAARGLQEVGRGLTSGRRRQERLAAHAPSLPQGAKGQVCLCLLRSRGQLSPYISHPPPLSISSFVLAALGHVGLVVSRVSNRVGKADGDQITKASTWHFKELGLYPKGNVGSLKCFKEESHQIHFFKCLRSPYWVPGTE